MWGGFVINEIMLRWEKIMDFRKWIYSSQKNKKSWILKALCGKHLLDFLKFLFQFVLKFNVFLTNQSHTFFVLSVIRCFYMKWPLKLKILAAFIFALFFPLLQHCEFCRLNANFWTQLVRTIGSDNFSNSCNYCTEF